MSQRKPIRRSAVRSGVLKTEVMLSLFLLVAAMNIASPLIHRINLLWMGTQNHQFAVNELANQMDELFGKPHDEIKDALNSLEVSDACKVTLSDPKISASTWSNELGLQITLELTWEERVGGEPVRLSAWHPASDDENGENP